MWIVSLHQFLTTLHVLEFHMVCTSPTWNQARGHAFLLQISAHKCCTCDAPQNCSKQRDKTGKLCLDVLLSCCIERSHWRYGWNSLRCPHLASVHLLHKRQSRRFQGLHLRKRALKRGAGLARTLLTWTTKKTSAQSHSTGWLTGIPYNGSTSHIPIKQGSNPLYTDTRNNQVFSLLASWIEQIPRLFCTCSSLM